MTKWDEIKQHFAKWEYELIKRKLEDAIRMIEYEKGFSAHIDSRIPLLTKFRNSIIKDLEGKNE